MEQDDKGNARVYRIGKRAALFGASKRVLPDAVAPLPASPPGARLSPGARSTAASTSSFPPGAASISPSGCAPVRGGDFGWVMGVMAAPNKGDHYLVEFVEKNAFRVIAYVDRYGRAFATDEEVASPPAREPDLSFARFSEQPEAGVERGCVQVRESGGAMRQVAQYRCVRGRYSLLDSWYDFGCHARNLCYDDALARCYFAFVHRPSLTGVPMPPRGVEELHARFRRERPLAALSGIVNDVRALQEDQAMRPPALARCLAGWIEEAGIDEVMALARKDSGTGAAAGKGGGNDPLRLVRTARYANTYYLGLTADAPIPPHALWALESALNRFLLVEEALGTDGAVAGDADCGRWDAYLIESIATRALEAAPEPSAGAGGEWQVRRFLGEAMERMRLPFRFAADFRVDASAGVVAFDVVVPDGSLMPRWRWDEPANRWAVASGEERASQARRYAEHLGLLLAAAAFRSAAAIRRVAVTARPLDGEGERDGGKVDGEGAGNAGGVASARESGEFPAEGPAPLYSVLFEREIFCAEDNYAKAATGDAAWFFARCGALGGRAAAARDPFGIVDELPSAPMRRDLPEVGVAELAVAQQRALGARTTYDLRINYGASLRREGESLAELVVRASSASEAIRAVRAVQEKTDNSLVYAACTRLMAALAEGSVDADDQNAVVASFIGEDPYVAALALARKEAGRDSQKAVAILSAAIAEAEAGLQFADNAEAVYRMFDTYASRIVYNIERAMTDGEGWVQAALLREGQMGAEASGVGRLAGAGEGTGEGHAAGAGAGEGHAAGAGEGEAHPHPDAGKRVELVPPTLVFCYLELVRLLEESFAHTDEALRYATRCMQMAPTLSVAYRQTARIYMLVGDMENAADVLRRCLRQAFAAEEIAIAYYQLAYVEWKSGHVQEGVACYVKSIMTSPVYAAQSTIELQELLREGGVELIEREQVDGILAAAGIPLAPADELIDSLGAAAQAAVDGNLFVVARALLSLLLHYRPDDALVNVLRSLGDS